MSDSKSPTPLIKSNTAYDLLKQAALVTLPALGTLYFALSQIWGLPHASQVVGTITAIDAFLGLVLHISTTQYNNSEDSYDGHIVVADDGAAALNIDSQAILSKKQLKVKVTKPD